MNSIKEIFLNNNEFVELGIYFLLTNLIIAYLLSYLLTVFYNKHGSSISNRTNFSKNFIILTLTIVLIISIVKSSLALSLGLVGALSIVRFRTPIKDPEELTYLFLCIAIGLGLGANQTIPTILSFFLIIILIFITKKFKTNREISKGVFLNLTLYNVNKKKGATVIKKINSILKSSNTECELRRLDIEKNSLDMSYLIIIENTGVFNKLINDLKNQYPNIDISAVDQNGIPSI